jgi:hypothetical protein
MKKARVFLQSNGINANFFGAMQNNLQKRIDKIIYI